MTEPSLVCEPVDPNETGDPLDPEVPGTLGVGWDIAFGCRVNVGPAPDGALRVSVHVSDAAQRDGVARLPTTPQAVRLLAAQLLAVADDYESQTDQTTSQPRLPAQVDRAEALAALMDTGEHTPETARIALAKAHLEARAESLLFSRFLEPGRSEVPDYAYPGSLAPAADGAS